jgi:diaminohydroxyphosphoribosylaminopyrimidine deaminase/5-amino-6-(5-phosphoribosylamino)uracil reductase
MAPKNLEKDYWLTHAHSRQRVHQWRSQEQGILLGSQSVIDDNPNLSTRLWYGKNPIRFAIDPNQRIPKNSNLKDGKIKTFFLEDEYSDRKSNKIISAEEILKSLYEKNIQSVIIEGGAKTLKFFIQNKIWDVARVFKTNKNLNNGLKSPKIRGELKSRSKIQNDVLLEITKV